MAHFDDPETQKANMAYIKRSMRQPLLDRQHELDLARRWRESGDEAALHELVIAYSRLVISIASRFRNYGLPLGDLIQEGNIGLMQAAARFEPERDVRFSTYANWWIRSAIQDYVLRNWSIVRTGTTAAQKSLFFNLRRLRAKLNSATKATLSPEDRQEIADELKVDITDVEAMEVRLGSVDQSLNMAVGEEGGEEWQNFIEDERSSPEQVVIGMRDSETRSAWLAEAIGTLPGQGTANHPRTPAGRAGRDAGGTGPRARRQQGACPPAGEPGPVPPQGEYGGAGPRAGRAADRRPLTVQPGPGRSILSLTRALKSKGFSRRLAR